jgi:hypothetical protein
LYDILGVVLIPDEPSREVVCGIEVRHYNLFEIPGVGVTCLIFHERIHEGSKCSPFQTGVQQSLFPKALIRGPSE